jgi:hypothetical protein
MPGLRDITGKKYGYLTVLSRASYLEQANNRSNNVWRQNEKRPSDDKRVSEG